MLLRAHDAPVSPFGSWLSSLPALLIGKQAVWTQKGQGFTEQ